MKDNLLSYIIDMEKSTQKAYPEPNNHLIVYKYEKKLTGKYA